MTNKKEYKTSNKNLFILHKKLKLHKKLNKSPKLKKVFMIRVLLKFNKTTLVRVRIHFRIMPFMNNYKKKLI